MKNLFNSVKVFKPNKNVFDLSHDVKLSAKMGNLTPVSCMHVVPGDKVFISNEALVRFAPLVSPAMHRFDVFIHYFFVPNRLLWDNWENFITNTKVAGVIPPAPTVTYGDVSNLHNKLADYLGLPNPHDGNVETVSAFPFAAYQKIYWDYYRDENLVTSMGEDAWQLQDGDNGHIPNITKGVLRQRAWEHDYYTSALPFAQKGDAVEIPITGDVTLKDSLTSNQLLVDAVTQATLASKGMQSGATGALDYNNGTFNTGLGGAALDPNGTMEVANAETTINDLRRAYRLQEFLEKLARGGSRYFETIKSMFGITSPDKRLQRAEYITGSKSPIMISEVLQTGETSTTPQGNMAGHGVSVTDGVGGSYFCEEHGMILGIMSVMPKTAYQDGINRHWLKFDPLDYYFPDFANIGEQEVKQREVYAFDGTFGDETFGYVPRYAEYKFENNRVAGDFRTSLDFWHEGRIFGSTPLLNETFITCNPANRIFAVDDGNDNLYCHVLNKIKMVRPMPKYGTPTF